jgi:hypothetical protein
MIILFMLLRKKTYIQKLSSSNLGLATGHPEGHGRLFSYACLPAFHHERLYCFFVIILSGVTLSSLGTAATTGLLYQPHMIDDGDCEAFRGMKMGRGNRSTRRKPSPAPLCLPQIPHDQDPARNQAAVGSQRITA